MALAESTIALRLTAGLDTKTDEKAVGSPRLLDLQNGVFAKGVTIKKRNGYRALGRGIEGTADTYAGARQLAQRGDELVLFTADRAYSHRPTADTWSDLGRVRSSACTETPLVRTGSHQTVGDQATAGGVTVLAWEDSRGGVYWTVLEAATERVLVAPRVLDAAGERPRCLAVGEVLHVYYAIAAQGRVRIAIVNPTTPTVLGASTILVDDLAAANASYDACPTTFDAGAPALIAWAQNGGGYRVGYVHASGVLGSPATGLPSVATWGDVVTGAVSCAYGGVERTRIGVAWASDDGDPNVQVRMTTATAPQASLRLAKLTNLDQPAQRVTCTWALQLSPLGNERMFVCADSLGTGSPAARDATIYATWYSDGGEQGQLPATYQRGLGLAARLVATALGVFVLAVYATTLFGTYFTLELVEVDAPGTLGVYVVGRHLSGRAAGLPPRAHLPMFDDLTAIAAYRDEAPGLVGTFGETGLARVSLALADDQAWQSGQLGRCLYLGGGVVQQYDGRRWAEAGFHYAADDLEVPTQADGGGLTAAARYGWIIVYEEVNAQGEVDRGAASVAVEITLTGSHAQATLKIPTCRLTGRDHVRIGVFRSRANDDAEYFRATSHDPSSSGDNRYIANDPTVDFVLWTDSLADAELATHEDLYTNGGVLSNDPPVSGRALAVGRGRLFFSDPFDPNLVRYSQQLANDGAFGVELADALAIRLPPYGGAVTGLAIMDDTLIVFRERALYFVAGTGPDANPSDGSQNGFADPVLITTDVGCQRPTSVGATPIGIVFQTAKGIYLLGRDRQVSYVGAAVEAYNAQTVRCSVLLPDRTQILMLCDSGRTLLYDYFFQQWSTFTNHTGVGAAVIAGVVHYLRTDGRVFVETPDTYRDDNSKIPLVIVTAWLHQQAQLQGLEHIYYLHILGTWRSPHTLQVDYQIDYQRGWTAPVFLDATRETAHGAPDGTTYGDDAYGDGPYGGTPATAYQWRVHLGQPCEAIRFRFRDLEAGAEYGASYELTELALTGGVQANTMRPFAANRSA